MRKREIEVHERTSGSMIKCGRLVIVRVLSARTHVYVKGARERKNERGSERGAKEGLKEIYARFCIHDRSCEDR